VSTLTSSIHLPLSKFSAWISPSTGGNPTIYWKSSESTFSTKYVSTEFYFTLLASLLCLFLAPLLKNDLIDHITAPDSSFRSGEWKLLRLLLNSRTKSLSLSEKQIDCDNFQKEGVPFWSQLVAKAPNLEYFSYSTNCTDDILLDEIKTTVLNTIINLRNLQHLRLTGHFDLDYKELTLLSIYLQNLVSLTVRCYLIGNYEIIFTCS